MLFPRIKDAVFSVGETHQGIYYPSGTCFILNKPGLFVTAAHVLKGSDTNKYLRFNSQYHNGYQDIHTDHHTCAPIKIEHFDPIRDLCIFSAAGDLHSNIAISNTDNVVPGESVTVFGFPHSNLDRLVLTQQTCEVGAKIYLGSNGVKSKNIVLNIQARPGQSGGPIIRNSDSSLIGILIGAYVPKSKSGILLDGIDPQTLHQTTHAVSAEYLEGML